MTHQPLLPQQNVTPYERAFEKSVDFNADVYAAVEALRRFKSSRPLLPSVAPWLLFEEGLSDIAPLFDSAEEAIDAGLPWVRQHGRPSALRVSFAWLDYDTIGIDDNQAARRNWNLGQTNMGQLPGADEVARLNWAEYLSVRSLPVRSEMFRGYYGYDVRACEAGQQKFGGALFANHSGVRLEGGSVLWSHGRHHAVSVAASANDRANLGIDYQNGDPLSWGDFPWSAPGVTWEGVSDAGAFKSFMALRLPVYMGFFDPSDTLIGVRRIGLAKSDRTADASPGGDLSALEFKAHTDFGDGGLAAVASVALIFNAHPKAPSKPGQKWLEPEEITFIDGANLANMTIGKTALSFTFAHTIREQITFNLTI